MEFIENYGWRKLDNGMYCVLGWLDHSDNEVGSL